LAWLLAGPWGANLRNEVSHGLPAPITPAYAALILRAVTVLAVVAGRAPITHVRAGHRRDRDEIIALLADPTGNAGRIGTWLAKAATAAERLVWRLHTAGLRRVLRRRPATPTSSASRPGAAPPRPADPPDGGA
jgi:hypothetical protein